MGEIGSELEKDICAFSSEKDGSGPAEEAIVEESPVVNPESGILKVLLFRDNLGLTGRRSDAGRAARCGVGWAIPCCFSR